MIQPVGIPSTWKFHTNSMQRTETTFWHVVHTLLLHCCVMKNNTARFFEWNIGIARGALLILRSLTHFGLFFFVRVSVCLPLGVCMRCSFTYLFVVITSVMWNIHHHFSSQNDDHIRTTAFTSIYALLLTTVRAICWSWCCSVAVVMNTEMKDELNTHIVYTKKADYKTKTMN